MMEMEHYSRGVTFEKFCVLSAGEQFCKSGHRHGPIIRENYIFHFVISGKGVFKTHGKTYNLKANQGFLIGDSTPVFYQADQEEPWHYCWIIFSGKQADVIVEKLGLSPENPIYTATAENSIYNKFKAFMRGYENGNEFSIASDFNALISEIYSSSINFTKTPNSCKEDYLQKAEQYILHKYHSPDLRIGKIASEIGIDRSYLTRLFDNILGISPQDYLLKLRMEKAKTFLQTTTYSVGTIANSVGYPNIDAFSKMFKRVYGYAPTSVRKNKYSMEKENNDGV
ncbi:MAG: AraC family transcriptional regulator [Clostridiales bacterium]|nr:AraC family transcriptional regulator [Clostridiales bacterium]